MNIDRLSDYAPRVWPRAGISGSGTDNKAGISGTGTDNRAGISGNGESSGGRSGGCQCNEGGAGRGCSGEKSGCDYAGNRAIGGARNGEGGNGTRALSSDSLRAIQELSFVKAELELYLDTHPDCKTALDYYHKTVDALDKMMAEYQAKGTPIVAAGSIAKDSWSWIKGPWPWQKDDEKRMEG